MKLGTIAEILMLIGLILMATAGFTISLTVGLFLSGVLTVLLGVVFFLVHLSNIKNNKGGDR